MPDLPEDRIELLHKTLPTVPIFPVDLFSRGTDMTWDKFKHVTPDDYIHNYPEILDLKVQAPAGAYDVVGMTNWRSWGETRQLWFAQKLGLDPDAAYVAFDFWNQKITGVFQKSMTAEVLPHDTRVFALHRIEGHPQLVGVSRHITGAYSVLQVKLGWREKLPCRFLARNSRRAIYPVDLRTKWNGGRASYSVRCRWPYSGKTAARRRFARNHLCGPN